MSCYTSGEIKRKICPLLDLSNTYFTVENIKTKFDREYRNRVDKSKEHEKLPEYEDFRQEEIKKLEKVVDIINELLKDKIRLFEYKERNTRTYASFELDKPLSNKELAFVKGKVNKEVFHINIDNGNNSSYVIEIHLKNPLENNLILEKGDKNNV